MSAAAGNNLDLMAPPIVKTIGRRALLIGTIAAVLSITLAFFQTTVFFRGYLLAFMDWLGLALGSMVILMLRHLTKGGWGMIIRRILGAAMRTIPLLTVMFVPLLLGMKHLYIWARPLESISDKHFEEHLREITRSYLSVHGFILRAVVYFAIWNALSFFLTKWSREQDQPPLRDHSQRFKALSGPGIILYGFTISFAAIDWTMSLDPSWISTIYPLIILIGEVLSALCFAVVVERILIPYKPMSELIKPEYVHDHGKFMLTFIMVWAYFSFSQWLIIWAGNLPEEITWYMKRLSGGWGYVGLWLVLFHFAVPFVFLLSRPFKRDVTRLVWLAVWLMFMRYVDLFWLIEPNFSQSFAVTWADILVSVALGGWWLAYFCRNLSSMPLVPAYDVFATEVLEPAHE
jgi:hypothetical protein